MKFHAPTLLFCGALLLYGLTAAPSIVTLFDDSLEFQLVGPSLGIAHPTGYPLYTLLGWLWSRALFPLGSWAWRMNLFSALSAALAVTLLFLTGQRLVRLVGGKTPGFAGLVASLSLGLSPVWWSQATVAEVYTLHGLFVAALLFLSLGFLKSAPPQQQAKRSLWLAGIAGLALAHHRTTLLLFPGLFLLLLCSASDLLRPQRRWFLWASGILAPLLLYLYIPLRASMGVADLNGDYVNSWQGFWFHVLAQGYTGFLGGDAALGAMALWDVVRSQLPIPLLLLTLPGIWALSRRQTQPALLLFLGVIGAHLIFVSLYGVGDPQVFLLPALLCLALLMGTGSGWLADRLAHLPGAAPGVQAGILLLLIVLPLWSGSRPTYSWRTHDWAVAMAKVDFPPQSRVIGLVGEVTALRYMQTAEGLGDNALAVAADKETLRRSQVAAAMTAGLPVYLTRQLPEIETLYSVSAQGPLIRLWPRGESAPPPPQFVVDAPFAGGRLRLVGYDLAVGQRAGGPALEVGLHWMVGEPVSQTYKLSLRIVDDSGNPRTGPDGQPLVVDRFPLAQTAPTWSWLPGERVRDEQSLYLPPNLLPSALLIILYDEESLTEAGRWSVPLPEY